MSLLFSKINKPSSLGSITPDLKDSLNVIALGLLITCASSETNIEVYHAALTSMQWALWFHLSEVTLCFHRLVSINHLVWVSIFSVISLICARKTGNLGVSHTHSLGINNPVPTIKKPSARMYKLGLNILLLLFGEKDLRYLHYLDCSTCGGIM